MKRPLLVIANKNYSSWSMRPWVLMMHFEIAFEERLLYLETPEFKASIGEYSPTGKVPVLIDDGLTVWDSLAICEYVNERWLDGHGWPKSIPQRALARAAAMEMHSGFPALREQLNMNCKRQPNAYRWDANAQADIERIQMLWRQLRECVRADDPYLCGKFGIVDAMFAPVVCRFKSYGVDLDDTARHYVETMMQTPALQQWYAQAVQETAVIAKYEKT